VRGIIKTIAVGLIVVIVGGLLVIGIRNINAAAVRIQCTNNLRQLGLAVLNYADTNSKKFPLAGMQNANLPPEKRLSWLVSIVPYIMSTDLYTRLDREKGWDADENHYTGLTGMRVFLCPGHPPRTPTSTLAPTDFVGISGIGADAVDLPEGDPQAGFFGYERQLSLAGLPRSAGTLMAITETSRASGAWTAAGPPTVRGLVDGASPYLGRDGQFGGIHNQGLNIAFADASVRFVKNSIDPTVFESLARIKHDGRPIRLEDD
jgi:prepilin-type processing-associated H-X9-DG protein